jgi:hypothetical protein
MFQIENIEKKLISPYKIKRLFALSGLISLLFGDKHVQLLSNL